MLAYGLVQKVKQVGLPQPAHIFFSGKGALHIERAGKIKYHLLGDEEFKEKVLELGGTPPQFFEHPELLQMFLPLLKNDFKIADSFKTIEAIEPLDCDITVLMGKNDVQSTEQKEDWKLHTTASFQLLEFEGGHFFINEYWQEIADLIHSRVQGRFA
jgi:surfactin synthase thioesterase subunit